MNILITGGNGYISRSLKKGLIPEYKITTLTRNNFDLTDHYNTCKWFENKEYDVVIHTAAVGGTRLQPDTEEIAQTNVTMYNNLYANKHQFKKLISFGSGAEIFATNTHYGISKKTIANSITDTANFYNLRIFATFDENELQTRFIKANILRYLKKEPMIVHTDKIMDFFYMKDLVSLVDHYITHEAPPNTINCCYSQKYTLTNITNIINKLDTYTVPVVIENKSKLDFYCGEYSQLPIETVGMVTGIKNTFEILRDSINLI